MGIATLVGVKPKKELIGLDKVENKDSETIRNEITPENILDALGYVPYKEDTSSITSITSDGESAVLTYDDGKTEEISMSGNDEVFVKHHDGTTEKLVINSEGNYTITETNSSGTVIKTTTVVINGDNVTITTK